eukprot:COSAG02_NODE_264_length_26618_cov_244.096459_3_plen_166_part_00
MPRACTRRSNLLRQLPKVWRKNWSKIPTPQQSERSTTQIHCKPARNNTAKKPVVSTIHPTQTTGGHRRHPCGVLCLSLRINIMVTLYMLRTIQRSMSNRGLQTRKSLRRSLHKVAQLAQYEFDDARVTKFSLSCVRSSSVEGSKTYDPSTSIGNLCLIPSTLLDC